MLTKITNTLTTSTQDVPTTEIGQRTKLSGLDRQQDSQPVSWRAQNKGLQIPVRDLARWSDIIIGYVARRSGLLQA